MTDIDNQLKKHVSNVNSKRPFVHTEKAEMIIVS